MKHPDNSTEFYWEKILRENDKKISEYMEKLPRYIHIPGEFNFTINNNPEPNISFDDDSDIDEKPFVDWQESKYASQIELILSLSKKWLMIYSAAMTVEEKKIAFTLISYLAMVTGQLIAIANNSGENITSFEVAMLKRIRRNISSIESLMRNISFTKPEMKDIVTEHLVSLSELSEKLADKIISSRKSKP